MSYDCWLFNVRFETLLTVVLNNTEQDRLLTATGHVGELDRDGENYSFVATTMRIPEIYTWHSSNTGETPGTGETLDTPQTRATCKHIFVFPKQLAWRRFRNGCDLP